MNDDDCTWCDSESDEDQPGHDHLRDIELPVSLPVDGIQCLVWKDNKTLHLLNTIVDPNIMSQLSRDNKDGAKSQIPRQISVKLNDMYMVGVDLLNSCRKKYSCSRKLKKWWIRIIIYYWMLL